MDRAYPAIDNGSSMKTRARAKAGCSSCSLILTCTGVSSGHTHHSEVKRSQKHFLWGLQYSCPTFPPGLRGQQQLHLQLCGLNSDPRGAQDEVEGDLR